MKGKKNTVNKLFGVGAVMVAGLVLAIYVFAMSLSLPTEESASSNETRQETTYTEAADVEVGDEVSIEDEQVALAGEKQNDHRTIIAIAFFSFVAITAMSFTVFESVRDNIDK
ncbi:MAG: hypothetical protein K6E79_05270 [Pseudobutyrivibrio sp.]|nr:hypothetical protein [Pseudobutyrivibrio sp.]